MKTNKIFILINELEESHFGKIPGLDSPSISFQNLLGCRYGEFLQFTVEDIFIGNSAKWGAIKERIEDYLQLSYLRKGKLEIIYCSIYDVLTRLYTNEADNYFHFFDNCIQRKEIETLIQSFPSSFDCKFINRSNENIAEELADQEINNGLCFLNKPVNFNFLTISNQANYLQTA